MIAQFSRVPALACALLVVGGAMSGTHAAQWQVDPAASSLTFEASVFGSSVPGSFEKWDADISFDEADLTSSSVEVVITMESATTNDATRDSSLMSDDWFAVTAHPQARLVSTAFRNTGDGTFEMDADLTMRGQTQAITLPFALEDLGDGSVRAVGTVTVDRTDYGIGQGDFTSGATVGVDVPISIDISAKPK
ncbi:YceI family protein [Pyruvatibacter mobilis]|uniref:YceI family protein n=1 Tax=Pyruvatibacter mobilis TaxID=1712261 RepID=UPI003D09727C